MSEIEICLSCQKAECDNCMGGTKINAAPAPKVPRAVRRKQVTELISRGCSSTQIARELQMDPSTARYWLKKLRCVNGQDVKKQGQGG